MDQIYHYQIRIEGFVQGIGFRPFVYKLAHELALKGWVNNDTEGVNIELETSEFECEHFLLRLRTEKPALAELKKVEIKKTVCTNRQFVTFEIHKSETTDSFAADVLPDLATCEKCLNDIRDINNRRYQYLFTNCTHCGPRFSIIQSLPYDRQNTTMASFKQCEDCQREYEDPLDRRFHAQPNACSQCGPQVFLKDQDQKELAVGFAALEHSVAALKQGQIIAIKGIGGYQLACDARSNSAIDLLRQRKRRRRKPFAVMMRTIEEVKDYCEVSTVESKELQAAGAPIVLLKRKDGPSLVSELVAPNNPYLGLFLPNTPMHFWLLELFGGPVVVTSANLSEEPLVYTESEVFSRLKDIADLYLVHNRPIARPIDDSVVQVIQERVFVLRSARGFAPLNIRRTSETELLATGPHMKNTFAVALKNKSILSQHIGDMESDRSQELFERELANYLSFYHAMPTKIICDAHPSYFTSEWAEVKAQETKLQRNTVQHHRAHIFATMAENQIKGSFLGVSWDGTGYGDDGTIWGSEIFLGDSSHQQLERIGSLRSFRLLGGEAAVRSPWKVALSLLFELDFELALAWFRKHHPEKSSEPFQVLHQMWEKQVNSPVCTSMGRFLEGVSTLLGIAQENEYEADTAIQLEHAAVTSGLSDCRISGVNSDWLSINTVYQWDWGEWVRLAVESILKGGSSAEWAADIHIRLAQDLITLAQRLGQKQILVGGGVFQNRQLMMNLLRLAGQAQMTVLTPSRVPINDGGIAMGQIIGRSF